MATKAALSAAQPVLERVFFAEAPILRPSRSQYPTIASLPGSPFLPVVMRESISVTSSGDLLLAPGDYSFPVMTYCMQSSSASPAGHSYQLAALQGKRAKIIREVNIKASEKYSFVEIQLLSWSLQAGLSYDELSSINQSILDFVNPEFKDEIKESFLSKFQQNWDAIASKSIGIIPGFDDATDEFLDEMGEVGGSIKTLKKFRSMIKNGATFTDFKNQIDTQIRSQSSGEMRWSKIDEGMYARFITEKSYLGVGQMQVRIQPTSVKRAPNSNITNNETRTLDLHSLIADPLNLNIQPLSFSMILWPRGMLGIAVLAEPPVIFAALFATILASQTIDWDSFFKLRDLIGKSNDLKRSEI